MKKNLFLFTILFIVSIFNLDAQEFTGMDKSPADISYARKNRKTPPVAKVIYGRPQKNDRVVFGGIIKFGKVWRTGANESTEITFYKDVNFGDKKVKAGTYTLYSIPEKDEWTMILNSDLHTWGAFKYNANKDITRIKVPSDKTLKELESFSITFESVEKGYHMVLGWENTMVKVPITF